MADKNVTLAIDMWGGTWRVIFTATAIVCLTQLLFLWISLRFRRRCLPPGPVNLPLLGALLSMGRMVMYPHRSLFELSKKYGPLMFMRLGCLPVLIISDAKMAKEVLQKNDHLFASRPQLLIPGYFSYNQKDVVFSPYGPHWRQVRKICNLHLFALPRLNHFSAVMMREIQATIHCVLRESEAGRAVNMSSILSGMTMNIVTQMMWNKRHRNINLEGDHKGAADDFEQIVRTMMGIAESNNVADLLPCCNSLALKLTGHEKMAKRAHKQLDDFLENVILEKERASNFPRKTQNIGATDHDLDFVEVLLKNMNESAGAQSLSRDTVKAILTDMILGGSNTTAVALDLALAALMRYPAVMRRAQDELTLVVGKDRLVEESDIPRLRYLGAIVKETLRMYTPGPLGIPHCSTADCKVGGFDVPANTTVFINLFALHHDPAVWDKPMEFDPDRFLRSQLDYKGRDFEFLPFGSGRRMCAGINLAPRILHFSLAQLLQAIDWSLPHNQKPESVDMMETTGFIVSRASPLDVIGKPRLARDILYPTTM